jgi:DNA replication protein DnaC
MTAVEPRPVRSLSEVLAGLESLIVNDERAAEHDAIVREAKAVEERQRRADRLEALGIELERKTHGSVVANAGLDLPRPSGTSIRAVQRWLWRNDLKPTLVLVGGRGCGKSVAAAWAVANFAGSACWYSASDIMRIFASNFGDALKFQERVKLARLSVLDDVATEPDRARMCAALIEILEKRKQRKTIITTNLGLADWVTRYPDERLHSRLKDAYFVVDDGPDLRGKP